MESIEKDMNNTLLIVDDDKINLTALSHILRKEYTIHEASDGESALRAAQEYVPDLILLDILMPGMDGYQVFSALQNSDITAHIPVIFITGLDNPHAEQKGLELGAVDYIHKPFVDILVKLRVRNQIQIINQMRTIEQLSMIDQLTNIPNRRHFDNTMESEWGRAAREHLPICFLLIDVDHFKAYNDAFGHQQGDRALCQIARVIIQTLKRATDFAARWGGEEFAVLLPNTDAGGGLEIGEQMRKNIEEMEILLEDGSVTKLTASVGVNAHKPAPSCSVGKFFSQTDKALYEAKNAGRNRVRLYPNEANDWADDDEMPDIDASDIRIPGVDAEAGASLYSGEMDIYIAVLRSFAANIPIAAGKMRNVSEGSLKEYATTVHGLKGSCASIGAEGLRKKAFELELKSKDGDWPGVLALNDALIHDTETLLTHINAWLDEFIND